MAVGLDDDLVFPLPACSRIQPRQDDPQQVVCPPAAPHCQLLQELQSPRSNKSPFTGSSCPRRAASFLSPIALGTQQDFPFLDWEKKNHLSRGVGTGSAPSMTSINDNDNDNNNNYHYHYHGGGGGGGGEYIAAAKPSHVTRC